MKEKQSSSKLVQGSPSISHPTLEVKDKRTNLRKIQNEERKVT